VPDVRTLALSAFGVEAASVDPLDAEDRKSDVVLTPATFAAARRLWADVSKNQRAALSSVDGAGESPYDVSPGSCHTL
jgi:hypothetical protein